MRRLPDHRETALLETCIYFTLDNTKVRAIGSADAVKLSSKLPKASTTTSAQRNRLHTERRVGVERSMWTAFSLRMAW